MSGRSGASPVSVTVLRGDVDDPLLELARAVRRTVFVDEQGVPADIETDGRDVLALHAIARAGDSVVGTGRLLVSDVENVRTGRVGRMAVVPAVRGSGVGAALLMALEVAARRAGAARIELHAQHSAIGFYVTTGYQAHGLPFEEAGIEHLEMRKDLPVLRPARDADGPALIEVIGGCFAEYPGCVLDVEAEEPWLLEPASAYHRRGGRLWVVESMPGGPVIACGGIKTDGDVAELKNLYVAAAYRRLGLATDLADLIEGVARDAGCERIELWTDTRFADAHRMYEARGYDRLPETRLLHDLSNTAEYHYAKPL